MLEFGAGLRLRLVRDLSRFQNRPDFLETVESTQRAVLLHRSLRPFRNVIPWVACLLAT